jgi:ATP-dependent helicase/DNAse subunit B
MLSTEKPLELGGVSLRGRIDRVEEGEGFFSIIDYKTGKEVPGWAELETGLSLQLPVYLAAAERLLPGGVSAAPAAALYYRLREPVRVRVALADKRFSGRAFLKAEGSRRPVLEGPAFRASITHALDVARRAAEGIASGRFPLTDPSLVEQVCTFCPYSKICRIQSINHVARSEPEGV